jgi:HD-GYP domain-containing protein (c-di-GMP phosphodiesterase class II)
MRDRLFYFEGSGVAPLLAGLAEECELVALPSAPVSPEGPGVLAVDAETDDLHRIMTLKGARPSLRVVVLAESELPAALSNMADAVLPRSSARAFLAQTLRAAFEHARLAHEHERTKAELAALGKELQELTTIGIKLSAEHDTDALLELILRTAREITASDAGSLYLVEEEDEAGRRLRFKLAQNDSLNVPFREFTLPINAQSVAGYVALTGEPLNLEDAYSPPPGSPFQINRAFDQQVGYRTKSMLVVPMKNPKEEVIGILQLINCKPNFQRRFASISEIEREVLPFSTRSEDLATSLASQAAVALENSRLYQSIQNLFEGFVKASVTAIESRDPTTSGHSFRVADLTVALAEVVDRADSGLYAAVTFTPEEMKEIRYASLLHDFGKVGVREEVLVKAKKLYPNHLELIKQRLEIIKRGIRLEYGGKKLDSLLAAGRRKLAERFAAYDAEMEARLREIEEDLEAIVRANEPSVLPKDIASLLGRIGQKSFLDYTGESRALLTPEETRILSIPRGSLTESEREQIQSHVIHTFQFLSQIPWTKEIRRIPSIARSHHEKLNGAGYPYGLAAEEIPVQSRMMTIADIFDALTAADRPYKKAVPVEQALEIMEGEVKGGYLDPVLFEMFVSLKIFRRIIKP